MAYKAKGKASTEKRKPYKMDRYLIAAHQPYEVRYVRGLFLKWIGETPVHPSIAQVKGYCKDYNNSRALVYAAFRDLGFMQLKPRTETI